MYCRRRLHVEQHTEQLGTLHWYPVCMNEAYHCLFVSEERMQTETLCIQTFCQRKTAALPQLTCDAGAEEGATVATFDQYMFVKAW